MTFKQGDTVRLKTGQSPLRVMKYKLMGSGVPHVLVKYVSALHYPDNISSAGKWRKAIDFVYYDGPINPRRQYGSFSIAALTYEEEQPVTTPTLYQTKDDVPMFGTHIATDSKGRFVLEMKGSGNVLAFTEDRIEEVTPFTFELSPLMKGEGPSCHVTGEEGQVRKGDVLLELDSGKFWRVTIVGSKARNPRPNKSKWMKVPMEKIMFGDK